MELRYGNFSLIQPSAAYSPTLWYSGPDGLYGHVDSFQSDIPLKGLEDLHQLLTQYLARFGIPKKVKPKSILELRKDCPIK